MLAHKGAFLGVAASLCLLIGFGFSLVGVDELHQALHCSAKPKEMTCSQLRNYSRGSNKHITLTNFVPYRDGILIMELKEIHSWSVWVPVMPADAPAADPKYITAVVALSGVSDDESLRRALARSRWTGVLHSQGDLEPYAKYLCQRNPGIHIANCWVMWEGHQLPELSSAIFKLIVCPCLFVVGMVLGVLAALRPILAPGEVAAPTPGVRFIAANALGDAVRWLYRRGYFSASTAVVLAVLGLAGVGQAVFLWHRDWDKVVNMKNEGQLLLSVIGGLIGLGFLAYAVLLGFFSWRPSPAPAPSPLQRIHSAEQPSDPRNLAGAVMVFGIILLAVPGNHYYHNAISIWTFVFAALGGLALAGGTLWFARLNWKTNKEPAQFWNQPRPQ